MSKPMHTETLSLRITEAESRALRARAASEGVSQGSIVRRALRAYGVVPEPQADLTLYDLIKDHIGTCKGGPSDLSTNPDHFRDFGL